MPTPAIVLLLLAQQPAISQPEPPAEPVARTLQLAPGTKIPLSLLNSVSTKNAAEGDRVYLETIFPIVVDGQVVIPVGSNVAGTVTSVKRAGRVKGKAELYVRFDSLILPNGTMRDFRSRLSNMDGTAPGKVDRGEGKIEGDGNKSGDGRVLGEAASTGAIIGGIAGAAAGRPGLGLGVGAAAGATAAMIGILASRGPDAVLTKGTTVEMLLDRQLTFTERDIDFSRTIMAAPRRVVQEQPAARQNERPGWRTIP
jgi:hypothetical protein